MLDRVKVAAAQVSPVFMDKEASIDKAFEADKGAAEGRR
jgi:predicted amidohydrolase